MKSRSLKYDLKLPCVTFVKAFKEAEQTDYD